MTERGRPRGSTLLPLLRRFAVLIIPIIFLTWLFRDVIARVAETKADAWFLVLALLAVFLVMMGTLFTMRYMISRSLDEIARMAETKAAYESKLVPKRLSTRPHGTAPKKGKRGKSASGRA